MQLWLKFEMCCGVVTECSCYLQSPQPAEWAFSKWGLSGGGTCLSTSRKMRLPLPAVAPPAAPTISVIQRCQLLTPQSHSSSPLKKCILPAQESCKEKQNSLVLCDIRSNVGDGKLRWFDWSDSNKNAIWWFSYQAMNECVLFNCSEVSTFHSLSQRGCRGVGGLWERGTTSYSEEKNQHLLNIRVK